jgi:hypothetical protein
MELRKRAEFYTKVTSHLYAGKDIRGKVKTATRGARHLSLGIRLFDPLNLNAALAIAESLALAVNCEAVIAQRRQDAPGLVTYQFQLQRGYWETYTRADVTGLGVGLAESRRQIDFSFDPPHALVAGTTGSGKTETVKTILTGLFTTFTPETLGAIVIDPHRDYDDFQNVAHLLSPVASTPEAIDHALMYASQELTDRKRQNRRNARRLVLVIDEAQDVLSDAKRLALVQTIGEESRKFNLNLVVASQKPTQANMPDLVHLLNNRFVGLVDNAHTSALLTGQAGMACHKLTGKGDFVRAAGNVQERLQVALTTRRDLEKLPRAEVREPEIEIEDITPMPETRGPGRPSNEPDPEAVGHYLYFAGIGQSISIAQASELLGLSKRAHYLNRDFAKIVLETVKRLHAERGRKNGQ